MGELTGLLANIARCHSISVDMKVLQNCIFDASNIKEDSAEYDTITLGILKSKFYVRFQGTITLDFDHGLNYIKESEKKAEEKSARC